jgi:transcription elongation GreA/GreB family factor
MADEQAKYQYGVDPDEVARTVTKLVADMNRGDAIVQFGMEVKLSSIDDFEFRQLTLVYAQKRKRQ